MTSFFYLKFSVLLFSLPLVGLAQNSSTSSTGIENALNQNMTTAMNLANASCHSDLRIDKSAVENILKLSHNYATHVIEISVNSGNDTRELKWSWADEIGRTIISLKASLPKFYATPFFYITLNPGIKKVNVVVKNYGCLPNGSNGSEIIFDFLLHQFFRSDDIDDYKLCRVINGNDDVKHYNCCRVASGGNLTICEKYLSVLLEYVNSYIFTMVFIMLYVGYPLILKHLQSIPKETEHYSITDSPMALSRIFYAVFLEGSNNPVTPYYRRLTFSLAVVVIIFITYSLTWIIVSLTWALLFTACDVFWLNEGATIKIEKYLIIFTLSFNVKYWWKLFKRLTNNKPSQHSTNVLQGLPNCQQSHEVTIAQQRPGSSRTKICCSIATQLFTALFFVITYTLCVIPMCLFIVFVSPILIICISSFRKNKRIVSGNCCVSYGIGLLYGLPVGFTVAIIIIFFVSILNLLLYLTIGLYLNGSFFSPIVVPILILLVYSWKNWRSFVETKYLQLKTAIYECCEEYHEKKSSEKKKKR